MVVMVKNIIKQRRDLMVKGISKRVVIVKPKEEKFFEQAIFIVRDEDVSGEDVLKEACAVAAEYLERKSTSKKTRIFRYGISAIIGALLMGGFWILSVMIV